MPLPKLCLRCGRDAEDPKLSQCESCRRKDSNARRVLKEEVLMHYGGKCSCCDEKLLNFLTLDHINNAGSKHRGMVGTGSKMYGWAKRNNFPPIFQTMCFNCNCGRDLNKGICPHKLDGNSND